MAAIDKDQIILKFGDSRSKHWKKQRIKKGFDKHLLALEKEELELWKIIRNMEYEELEVPVQRGYKKLFELSEYIKFTPKAGFFQEILDKINDIRFSPYKTFKKVRKHKNGKWKYIKKHEQKLRELSRYDFNRLTGDQKLYFYPIEHFDKKQKQWVTNYRFAEPDLFVSRIRPNLLTRVQKRNWEAERRMNEISDYLRKNAYSYRLDKLKYGACLEWRKDWRGHEFSVKYDNPLKNKPLYEIEAEYNEEK